MPVAAQEPASQSAGFGRKAARTVAELLITVGLVMLLFVVYALYVTNWTSARLQQEASSELDKRWSQERQTRSEPIDGKAFGRIYIPSFGADYRFTIQQGVDAAALEVGPGHYKDTAMPGKLGNFGLAGHRVGKGAPFNDLDLLNSCDAIVIETADTFFVYRVLPMKQEIADWESGKKLDRKCTGVSPLDAPYDATFGRVIVTPDRRDAVSPVPYKPAGVLAKESHLPLLSLTTCHPWFSERERLIIHAVLTDQYEKTPGAGYVDLLQTIGET
nr:class E sortase [Amycolatopsis marina]